MEMTMKNLKILNIDHCSLFFAHPRQHLLVTTLHLMTAGNTSDGDWLFGISGDSWRQLT